MKKITIGIDFSKEKFDVTVINIESSEIIQGQFVNKASGARDMIRMVKRFAKGTEASDWLFCGEDTGYYSQLVTRYLVKKGYFMWLQNPFAIKHSVGKIRRGKDDKTDSAMIAEYAQRFMDKAKSYELPSECIEQLRALLSKRDALVRAKKVIACGTGELPDLGKQTEAVTVIKATTKHLVNEIDKTIKKLEDKMREIINRDEEVKKNYDILTSFVGIGLINATSFIAYTENFTKYDLNARKIATAWGVAPFHQESGTSVHTARQWILQPLAKGTIKQRR